MLDLEFCARVKRITLSMEEHAFFREKALRHLAKSGWQFRHARHVRHIHLDPLSVSDHTQTYRATGSTGSAILKLLPPHTAALTVRVHRFFSQKGIASPVILWEDTEAGAILFEDLGSGMAPADADPEELVRIVRYLALLHDAAIMDETTARLEFPDLSTHGFPRPAELAAVVVQRYATLDRSRRAEVLEAAAAVVEGMPEQPFLAISDIKREHFFLRRGEPVLVDLEMASFWDLPAANLATLLSFPGQFTQPLDIGLKQMLIDEYARARRRDRVGPEALWRAVRAAEFLMSLTLSTAREHCRRQPGYMVRNRRLDAGVDGGQSVEVEIGPENFHHFCRRLDSTTGLCVLDLASGAGVAVAEMAKRWRQHRFVALDLYPEAGTPGAVRADAQQLPFVDAAFDVVLCVQLLQYIPDKLALIREVYRALKPGGVAVFAMTEHFGDQSGFVPTLPEIAAAIQPVMALREVASLSIGERRVTTLHVVRGKGELLFPWRFESAVRKQIGESIDSYYQSRYRPG